MNAPGLNFTGIHARSPETTATEARSWPFGGSTKRKPRSHRSAPSQNSREAAAFAPAAGSNIWLQHALFARCCPKHAAHDPEGPVLVSRHPEPVYSGGHAGGSRTGNCIRPDTGLHKNARSDNIPFEHTRFGDPLQTGEFAPLRHIGVSHSHGYAAVILSAQPCAVDIEPADSDFSRAARHLPQEQALPMRALRLFSPHWSGVQRAVYKWVRISGGSLSLRMTSITEIHRKPPVQTPPGQDSRPWRHSTD